MKYTIEWSEVTKTGETDGRPWKMTKMNLKDENGDLHDGVTTFDSVMTGGELEGEIIIKGIYKNFKNHIKRPTASMYNKGKGEEITANQLKVQDKISENVEKAQDRTAWMWAKNNASTLLANKPEIAGASAENIANAVIKLASLIYKGELIGGKDKELEF